MSGKSSKTKGIIGTILFHALILLLLMAFGFSTPLPLPAEQGILINFGNSENGLGATEPLPEEQSSIPPPRSVPTSGDNTPITQDYEEAPSLPSRNKTKTKPKKKKRPTPKKSKPTPKETSKTEKPVETPKPRKANKKALFPGRKANGSKTGEGDTGNQGNQGGIDGSVDSQNRTGSTGGNGNAQSGIIANLNGRTALSLPKPEYPSMKEGRVVVRVTVNNQGRVTKVIAGVKGTTILDKRLWKAAEKAAWNAKFNVKVDAPPAQIGTITYIFKLQ